MRSKSLIAGLLCLLAVTVFISMNSRSENPEEQLDSTQMKLIQERVRVTVKKRVQYEFLKEMVGECPPFDSTHGEPWEFIINQWQRTQLERIGAKVRVRAELKPGEGPNQVEYRLVREIDLKADGGESIVFGPKKDKSSALSEIILGLKDEGKGVTKVFLYDFNFNLIGEMHLRDVTFSRSLRYFGGINYVKIPSIGVDSLLRGDSIIVEERVTYKVTYNFELLDYTGKKLCELEERELHEVNSTYSISNKGTVIERHHGSGEVSFYDQKGNEIKKIKVCISSGTPGEGISGGVFSDDGEYVLIVADQFCRDTLLGEKVRVLFFSWDGEELWRFNTEENTGGGGISKFGNYVIVSSSVWPSSNYPRDKRSTYLLSSKGELLMKYENVSGSPICFSSSEKYALFHSPHEGAFLINLPSGEVVLQYGQANSLDIAEDAKMFGLASSSAVSLIGFDGSKVWSDIFPSQEGRSLSPVNLRLSDDGKQMVIAIGSKIMVYQQVE